MKKDDTGGKTGDDNEHQRHTTGKETKQPTPTSGAKQSESVIGRQMQLQGNGDGKGNTHTNTGKITSGELPSRPPGQYLYKNRDTGREVAAVALLGTGGGLAAQAGAGMLVPYAMSTFGTSSALGALHAPASAWGAAALLQSAAVGPMWPFALGGAVLLSLFSKL